MIRTKLFARHYLVTTVVLLSFVLLGTVVSHLLTRLMSQQNRPQPMMFFAKVIDEINPANRIEAISRIQKMDGAGPTNGIILVDNDGKVLFPEGKTLPFDWDRVKKPNISYQESLVPSKEPFPTVLIRLPGEPAQYLVADLKKGGGPPPFFFIFTFGFLFLSIFMGAGFALYLLFRTMNEKIILADSVIEELKKGNLKARFPVTRKDEIGQVMIRFNKMADEIEHLVEQLKTAEQSRMALLQELAHDLRTPVASLKNLLETLSTKRESLTKEVQDEFFDLSIKEVEYFERLVEDLLTLAQVSEPKYQRDTQEIFLEQVLEHESEAIRSKYSSAKPIALSKVYNTKNAKIVGDPQLIRRLVRNVLDNAFSFANGEIRILVDSDGKALKVRVEDDGDGFSEKALSSFGQRQVTRRIGDQKGGRLSVGLGSVIMKAVTDAHRGHLKASNRTDANGRVLGAAVEIELPLI